MADKTARTGAERQRLKTLAQAALNADVTVGQLEDVLGGLDHFETTLSRIDDLMGRLVTLVAPVEAIVERIDYMVSVGETVMSPFSVTEHAVRNVMHALRNRTVR